MVGVCSMMLWITCHQQKHVQGVVYVLVTDICEHLSYPVSFLQNALLAYKLLAIGFAEIVGWWSGLGGFMCMMLADGQP